MLVSVRFPPEEGAAAAPSSWVGSLGSPLPVATGRAQCGRAGLAAGCPQVSGPLVWRDGEGISGCRPFQPPGGCCGIISVGAVGGMIPVQSFHQACCGGIPARRGAGPSLAVEVGVQWCRSEGLLAFLNLARLLQSFPGSVRGGTGGGGLL